MSGIISIPEVNPSMTDSVSLFIIRCKLDMKKLNLEFKNMFLFN